MSAYFPDCYRYDVFSGPKLEAWKNLLKGAKYAPGIEFKNIVEADVVRPEHGKLGLWYTIQYESEVSCVGLLVLVDESSPEEITPVRISVFLSGEEPTIEEINAMDAPKFIAFDYDSTDDELYHGNGVAHG